MRRFLHMPKHPVPRTGSLRVPANGSRWIYERGCYTVLTCTVGPKGYLYVRLHDEVTKRTVDKPLRPFMKEAVFRPQEP